jgi:hypothetical protein
MCRLLVSLAVALLSACSGANDPGGTTSSGATSNPRIWANGTGETCATNAPAVSLPAAQVAALPPIPPLDQLPRVISGDISNESLAQLIPGGWAGGFKANGKLVLLFADTSNLAASLDSVAIYGPSFGINLPASRDLLEVVRTRWTWGQLVQWYQYLEPRILAQHGSSGSSIDVGKNRILFHAFTRVARDDILATLAALHVPCWLAAVNVEYPSLTVK